MELIYSVIMLGLICLVRIYIIFQKKYNILEMKILNSSESYYTLEILLHDQRKVFNRRKPFSKKVLCFNRMNNFWVTEYGTGKCVDGIDKNTIESYILSVK